MENKKLTRKQLEYYAEMAAKAYSDYPVYVYACKNEKLRRRFLYHFMIARLTSSNGKDFIFTDEKQRGIIVWRDAHRDYTLWQFLKCRNYIFLCLYMIIFLKTVKAFSHRDMSLFEKGTLLIEPVFVDPEHQGRGVASSLISRSVELLRSQGYDKLGLETQDEKNVPIYEKLGFRQFSRQYFKSEGIYNICMRYEPQPRQGQK